MNALSLRVSSIRNGENLLKNSEIRVAVLSLPAKHSATPNGDCIDSDLANLKHEFSAATSIDQQLVTIRRCFTAISPDISTDALSQIIQLITDVYFFAPLKHPVRNGIVKLLQKAQIFHGLITQCLVDTITEQTQLVCVADQRTAARELNATVLSLSGCFENFPIALTAVKMCLEPIYSAIGHALHSYWLNLTLPDNSPAQRSEVYIFVHSAVRLCLSVVQLCFAQTSIESLAASLQPIGRQCLVLIDDRDVPMDTKVNCGQLLLLHAKLLDNIDEVFDEIVGTASPVAGAQMVRILVLCVGVVTTVSESHLEENDGCIVLRVVVDHLVAIGTANAIEQNVLIAVARGLVQLSKVLMQFKLTASALSDLERAALQELSASMLAFVWTFMEHYLDSVRHLSRDLLLNLLKLAHKHGRLFGALIDECVAVARADVGTAPSTVQCMAIDNLAQVLGARVVLERFPGVCTVLMRNLTEYNWILCYDKLMVSNSKDQTLVEWFERWVQPILGYSTSLQARETIVSSAIKTRPDVVELIVADKQRLPIETYLFVVWTVRRNGLKLLTNWEPARDDIVLAAKVHSTDAIRIMPLRVLVDVNRTTETFSRAEMHEILAFLYYNCNSQCPSMRMLIGVQMHNALFRIELSHAVAVRSAANGATVVRDNVEFLMLLRDLCVGNLFGGANFSRRSTSLGILLSLVRTVQKMRTTAEGGDEMDATTTMVWTHTLIDEMYKVLESDTYESNKVLAIDILKCCPPALNPVERAPGNMKDNLQKLLTSVRPGESLAATYLVEYCCIFRWHFATAFEAIEWCEELLIAGLRNAQTSLLDAARHNPLYGLVFCIKHLIDQLDLKSVDVALWRPFLVRFIGTCKELLAVVAPVVNSSSPEGHLPEEFDAVANNGTTTTAQMLLLCAWRTVKEVSLLLGELTLLAPIVREPNATHGLIRIDDILQIGRTFQVMLTETKHRGAFEQAYVGFSKLCVRLWRSNEPELHSCPMRWLHALIDLIASNEHADGDTANQSPADETCPDLRYDRICATRRSAGVPFMIQALITAELQVCASSGLHYSMRRLIELCRSGAHEETRTHALNILRALFRCTELGKAVAEYVSDGLECAIRGYTACTWPERNSATLLFAALVTRIFGVQRTRHSEDTLSIRNRMTGRIFFLRYPRLYDFMAVELRAATETIAVGERPAMLHPLLLLLSRLYPSALEGCENSLQLSAFLPDVLGCCVCAELETRRLAVRSVVALVAPNAVIDHIDGMLETMLATGWGNSNAMHGYLLQIGVLIRSMTTVAAERERSRLTELWHRLLLVDMFRRPNYVLVRVYVDVLNAVLLQMPALEDCPNESSALQRLRTQIEHVFTDRRTAPVFLIGRAEAIKSCVLFDTLLTIRSNAVIEDDCRCLLYRHNDIISQTVEYIDTVLNLMQLILNADCAEPGVDDEEENDEYAYTTMELSVHAAIQPDQIQAIANKLKSSVLLKDNLLRVNKEPQFYPVQSTKALSVLSRLNVHGPMSKDEMLGLLASIDHKPDNVRNAGLKWVTANLAAATQDVQVMEELFRRLREATDPNALDKLRVTAAICLCNIPDPWQYPNHLLIDFCDLVLAMLRDDHYTVREHLARYVQKLCGQTTTTVVPISLRAEELFLQRLALHTKDQTFWSELLQRQMDDPAYDDSSDSALSDPSEVFNKNEANLFGEQFNTARLIYFRLRQLGDADCLERYRFLAGQVDYGFACPYVERSNAQD